jgi:hypothetical protein
LAGGFLDALFSVSLLGIGRRLDQRQTAHQLAASRPWAWDSELVGSLVATYDPLPTTGAADRLYREVGDLLCDSVDVEWDDAHALESLLSRELGLRSRGEEVDVQAIRRLARRLATEHRRHFAYVVTH